MQILKQLASRIRHLTGERLVGKGGAASGPGIFPSDLPDSPEGPEALHEGVRLAISNSDPSSYFKCSLNGASVWLPTETLCTMTHCIFANGSRIVVLVETAHIRWMMEQLRQASGHRLFVDVGAATGAATIPIALKFSENLSIVAFEPASDAHRLLHATVEKNNIKGVTLVNSAVADASGEVSFVEFCADPSGLCPFLPEGSSIAYPNINAPIGSKKTTIGCVTLDQYFCSDQMSEKYDAVVVKIDVEGFEEQVLMGATKFIAEKRPFFSIDIHQKTDGPGTTEEACRKMLSRFQYSFAEMDHVLLATPG